MLNFETQEYKGIRFKLINRGYPKDSKAKRFVIEPQGSEFMDNQNVWIPNKHLKDDGTLKGMADIDYVFRKAGRQLELAGYIEPIIGIKRRSLIP